MLIHVMPNSWPFIKSQTQGQDTGQSSGPLCWFSTDPTLRRPAAAHRHLIRLGRTSEAVQLILKSWGRTPTAPASP